MRFDVHGNEPKLIKNDLISVAVNSISYIIRSLADFNIHIKRYMFKLTVCSEELLLIFT